MQSIINYDDKVALYENSDIADINKVSASDMNEIKSIVNGSLQGTNAMGSIVVDDINCKNLLPNNIGSQSINGLTVTRNSDGSLNINGTASAQTEFYFLGQQSVYYPHDSFEVSKTYKYSCVPNNVPNYKAYATVKHSNGTIDYNEDSGSGVNFTVQSGDVYRIFLRIVNGAVVNNVTFKPMVELGTTKTEYAPYKKIIKEENGYVKEDTIFYANDFKCKNLCNGINQNVFLTSAVNSGQVLSGNTGLYIKTNGGKYTISTTDSQARYRVGCSINEPSTTAQTAYNGVNKDNTSDTITIDTTGYNYLIVNATDLSKIQIEPGSEATPYTEYKNFDNTVYVLWTNSAPTSSFANQTITLSDSIDNYSYYEIIYRHDTTYGRILSTGKIPSNSVAWLQLNRNYNYFRLANVNNGNQATINDCNYFGTYGSTTTTTANNYLIPLQIIAYK